VKEKVNRISRTGTAPNRDRGILTDFVALEDVKSMISPWSLHVTKLLTDRNE